MAQKIPFTSFDRIMLNCGMIQNTDVPPTSSTPLAFRSRLLSIFGGSIGNLVEWYDWYVYSAFSLYFAHAFFPQGDLKSQLLNTAGIFAIGFLMRPLGGWLMGWYADRHGRKAALTLSVTMMSAGSLIVACAPTYASVGIVSPLILIFARLVQGLSVGGEYGTSATYLSEMATHEHRGFYSSFQYVTLIMGQLLALFTLIVLQRYLLTTAQLEEWGWRIPFAIGAALAILVFYVRLHMVETQSFVEAKTNAALQLGSPRHPQSSLQQNPLRELLRYPREILVVVGLTMGGTVAFYTYTTYMQKFLVTTVGMAKDRATLISTAALVIYTFLQPAVGALSDLIGRKPVLISFGVLGTLLTYPILTSLSQTKSEWSAFLLILLALVIISGYTAINAVVKAELFPVSIRALGVGLPYAIAVSVFGGTAEYLALWTKDRGHESWYFVYVTACIAVSLIIYLTMKDTRRHSKIDART